jgi:trehalose-6-phosphate synthase
MLDSTIILSEFAGVSQVLPGIHKCNALSVADIRRNLEVVWSQTQEEKLDFIELALNYLDKHSTIKWAHSFLKDLKRTTVQPKTLSYFMGTSYNLLQSQGMRLIRGN